MRCTPIFLLLACSVGALPLPPGNYLDSVMEHAANGRLESLATYSKAKFNVGKINDIMTPHLTEKEFKAYHEKFADADPVKKAAFMAEHSEKRLKEAKKAYWLAKTPGVKHVLYFGSKRTQLQVQRKSDMIHYENLKKQHETVKLDEVKPDEVVMSAPIPPRLSKSRSQAGSSGPIPLSFSRSRSQAVASTRTGEDPANESLLRHSFHGGHDAVW